MTPSEQPNNATLAIRVLQIGDIHYPEWRKISDRIDTKDGAFPEPLGTEIGRSTNHPIQIILRKLSHLIHNADISAVLVVGDITTKGDHQSYENALKHLSPILNMNAYIGRQPNAWLVPGNHDINRQEATDYGQTGKFNTLISIAAKYKWLAMPTSGILTSELSDGPARLNLIQINSCLGCGDHRGLPEPIRRTVKETIDKLLSEPAASSLLSKQKESADDFLADYYESLDTPAFSDEAIDNLMKFLDSTPDDSLNVILTHHNLLPQGQPRLAVYGELVNGGYLRRNLLSTPKTTIYLHGHIHDDPVEKISNSQRPGAGIICISAPEISRGFNELIFIFDAYGSPLGLRVKRHRFDRSAGLHPLPATDIPLSSKPGETSATSFAILQKAKALGKSHFQQLLQDCSSASIDANTLSNSLQQLYFQGLIRVDHPENEIRRWTVTA